MRTNSALQVVFLWKNKKRGTQCTVLISGQTRILALANDSFAKRKPNIRYQVGQFVGKSV